MTAPTAQPPPGAASAAPAASNDPLFAETLASWPLPDSLKDSLSNAWGLDGRELSSDVAAMPEAKVPGPVGHWDVCPRCAPEAHQAVVAAEG